MATMTKTASVGFHYPEPVRMKCGGKVSWYFYSCLADAKAAAKVAEDHASWLEEFGYDWGFQSPGRIEQLGDEFVVIVP